LPGAKFSSTPQTLAIAEEGPATGPTTDRCSGADADAEGEGEGEGEAEQLDVMADDGGDVDVGVVAAQGRDVHPTAVAAGEEVVSGLPGEAGHGEKSTFAALPGSCSALSTAVCTSVPGLVEEKVERPRAVSEGHERTGSRMSEAD